MDEKRKLENKVFNLQNDLKEVLINRKSLENINEIILKMSNSNCENDNQMDNFTANNILMMNSNGNSNQFDENKQNKNFNLLNSNSNNFSTGISYKNDNNCNSKIPEWYMNLKSKLESKKNY